MDGPLAGQIMVLEWWAEPSPPVDLWIELLDGQPGRSLPGGTPPETADGWLHYATLPAYLSGPGDPYEGRLVLKPGR